MNMMTSSITKKYKKCSLITWILSFSCTILPMAIYTIMAFINNEVEKVNKYTLGLMCSLAIIVTLINIIAKLHLRCIPWILLLGIYICLKDITTLLIIMAITTIIDELILMPLHKSFRNKYTINKEIDKRL